MHPLPPAARCPGNPPARRPGTATSKPARGLSVIELLGVATLLCLLLTLALPSMRDLHSRQLLRAVAAELEADVHQARSLALVRERGVRLAVQPLPGGGSCTLLHTGPAQACRCTGQGQALCSGGATVLKLSEQALSDGVAHTNLNRSLLFDPGKGTVTPTATLTIADTRGNSVRKIINIMGRVRSCSPSGLSGLPSCS